MRIMTFAVTASLALMMLLGIAACSNSLATEEEKVREKVVQESEQKASAYSRVGPNSVSPALKHFLLVRKDKRACAVKFTSFRRDHDWEPASWTSTGEENTYAEYDWYFQGDGSFNFNKPNVSSGHGKLRWGPITRLGHGLLLWGPSDANRSVDCGSFHIRWSYPMNLSFYSFEGEKSVYDRQLEFAPTRWTTIDQINFDNKQLIWTKGTDPVLTADKWMSLEDLP